MSRSPPRTPIKRFFRVLSKVDRIIAVINAISKSPAHRFVICAVMLPTIIAGSVLNVSVDGTPSALMIVFAAVAVVAFSAYKLMDLRASHDKVYKAIMLTMNSTASLDCRWISLVLILWLRMITRLKLKAVRGI